MRKMALTLPCAQGILRSGTFYGREKRTGTMTDFPELEELNDDSAAEETPPAGRRKFLLPLLLVAVVMLVICVVAGIFAFQPFSAVDQRPRIAAMFATATATSTNTPTPTLTPFPTNTPTQTPDPVTPTETGIPTETPIPTPTYTPTPLPTPDGREREYFIPILMYHYVSTPPADADIYRKDLSVTPENFAKQMQWLKDNGYETITLYDLIYALNIGWPPLPEKPIIITFDDGYVDNYENAYPILSDLDFTGTFFVLTDVTDRSAPGYMTWDMLKEMSAAGMSIEVHGREHIEYSGRDTNWLVYHLLGPAETIEANLGYKPRFIAYTAGKYDQAVIDVAHEQGFWAGITTQNGTHHTKDNLFELQRLRVRGDWSLDTFEAVIINS